MSKTRNKPTRSGQEVRIQSCEVLIAKGLLKCQIKRALAQKYGMAPRTVERYMARARESIIKRSETSVEETRAIALARYNEIFRNPATSEIGRIKALTRIDKIEGNEAAARMGLSGTQGGPIEIEVQQVHAVFDILKQNPETAAALRLLAKEQIRALTSMRPITQVPQCDAANTVATRPDKQA